MKNFPGLRILSGLYRLSAVLIAIGAVLAALGSGDLQDAVILVVVGWLSALTVYAVGEAIVLFLDWHEQQSLSTEAQIRMYQAMKDRPVIKNLRSAK